MKFEMLNWKAEAKRICMAFNIEEECLFFYSPDMKCHELRRACSTSLFDRFPHDENGITISIRYTDSSMSFGFSRGKHTIGTGLELNWDGTLVSTPLEEWVFPNSIPRAFYLLGLLTPKVEDALRVNISQHQRIEWQLEFMF